MVSRDPLADPGPLIRRLYAYVAYCIGDGPDAEDVTSQALERALRYRQSYDPRRGAPMAWLIGIARRCMDGAVVEKAFIVDDIPDGVAPGDLESDTVRRLTLAAAVGRLDERSRELIALRYGADLTARQIAEFVGAETHAVEVALQRALARLGAIVGRERTESPSEEPVRI